MRLRTLRRGLEQNLIKSKMHDHEQTSALNLRDLRTSAGDLGSGLRRMFVEQERQ